MKSKLLNLALASLITGSAFAGNSIAIVDVAQVFQQVPQGNTTFNTLKQQLMPQVTQLQAQQQALQTQLSQLNNNKSLSKNALASKKAQLQAQSQALQTKIQQFQQQASQQEQNLLTTFGNQVKGAVAQIAKQNDYDVVLSSQSSVYAASDVDITSQVVSALQKQAPATSDTNSTTTSN